MRNKSQSRRGSAMLEFTLVGIPMLFVLVSTFELARGMWVYHTLSNAAREGAHYATRHANDCVLNGNACGGTLAGIGTAISQLGVGLIPADVTVTLSGSTAPTVGPMSLSSMQSQTTQYWPTKDASTALYPGGKIGEQLNVRLTYPFQSAIAMFWPGAGGTGPFPAITFWAASQETIQF